MTIPINLSISAEVSLPMTERACQLLAEIKADNPAMADEIMEALLVCLVFRQVEMQTPGAMEKINQLIREANA